MAFGSHFTQSTYLNEGNNSVWHCIGRGGGGNFGGRYDNDDFGGGRDGFRDGFRGIGYN